MWLGREVAEWTESCSRRGRDTQILTSAENLVMFSPSRRKIGGMGEGELGLRDGTLLCTAGMHGGMMGYQMGQSIKLISSWNPQK